MPPHPDLHLLLSRERDRALTRTRPTETDAAPPTRAAETITIRPSRPHDYPAVTLLALRRDRRVPRGPLLVAEVDGSVEAALPLDGGAPVAAANELVPLLELRAGQLRRAA